MITEIHKNYYFSKFGLIGGFITLIMLFIVTSFVCFFSFYILTNFKELKGFKFIYLILLFFLTFSTIFIVTLLEATNKLHKFITLYFKNTPALTLTIDELIDNINGNIYNWTDIKSIAKASVHVKTRINFIAISLNNPNKFIDRIPNPYKRLIARMNEKYFRGAFSIQPNIIKCKNYELLVDLTEWFNKESQNSSQH